MKVISADFVKSVMRPQDCPRDGRPEFAFVGRSNVGKSSLLNAMLGKNGLAKTSSTPGKTQTLNYFNVNGKIYFVDLPGYGFAKVPKSLKDAWNRVMLQYLRDRDPLRMAALLLDARHLPNDNDLHMLSLLEEAEVPTLVVATKIDKLKRGERNSQLAQFRKTLELDDEALLIPFSAVTGEGVRPLWEVIDGLLLQ